jgi:hypothetical protein
MGVVSVKFARSFDAEAATAVGVIDKDEFAPVGMCFVQGRKLPRFRAERFFLSVRRHSQQGRAECQHGETYAGLYPSHNEITLLLSPN